ncbi:serine/arginine-rich splicing factor RS31-like [Phragmites australis]|uniref:serine/arginine-rich splicing factor RS31-like n=1 Tax=Phragmites australis TaxID=29695 RepID=UPI002D76652B|nr:serine/arginine-rich splicing factor RS31-like [Phragmites australis]XP_062225130.1 serine/arginine-rich splicing factor RS31-like [Phragmites australis]
MRPVFVGNLDYDTRHSELDRLFYRYGRIERIDMKSGFAFVYFEDERDGDDAIRALDGYPFGPGRRRLSVEWSRGDRAARRDGNKPAANTKPTKTLFVINFDPINTRVTDIERHFGPFGNISNVRIRRNFAFVQFETLEEATKALEATHATTLLDRVISVEYAFRDDGERSDRYDSPRREGGGGGYGRRGDSPYRRSVSPVYRSRPSPDYGRSGSPVYGSYDRSRSPVRDRYRRSPVPRSRSPPANRRAYD